MGATGSILSASVAFVALSGEAEYGYAWLFASVVTGGFVRRKPPLPRLTRTSWRWFKPVSGGSSRQGRQSEAETDGKRNCPYSQDLHRVSECDGRYRQRLALFVRVHAL
jgi:hypothetical protein